MAISCRSPRGCTTLSLGVGYGWDTGGRHRARERPYSCVMDVIADDVASRVPVPGELEGRARARTRVVAPSAILLALLLLGGGGIYAWNYFGLQRPMHAVLDEDPRNQGISIRVHREYYVSPSTIVFDIRGIEGEHTRLDVFRVLLQYAAKMKDETFDNVLLASDGTVKFIVDGDYFKSLGEEFGVQNPMYTVRTFPSHVKRPDGSAAYGQWTGGLLGVVGKQMEDFADLCDKWFVRG
jgi:hypothetical protein